MSRTIYITERQVRKPLGVMCDGIVNEAMLPGFSFEHLKEIGDSKARASYCQQYLGEPVGEGSARLVFQIDDEMVLKLAKGQLGISQNWQEGMGDERKDRSGLFPRVFRDMSDTSGYTYLVSEYVLPAEKEDFPESLGIDFQTFTRFLEGLIKLNGGKSYFCRVPMVEEEIVEAVQEEPRLAPWYRYLTENRVDYMDMMLCNFGLALRGGQPTIVVLDSGLDSTLNEGCRLDEWLSDTTAPLYHNTGYDGLLDIVKSDCLRSGNHGGYGYMNKNRHECICFTRDRAFTTFDMNYVRLTIDTPAMLSRARGCQLVPYNDMSIAAREQEERLVSRDGRPFTVPGLHEYVTEVAVILERIVTEIIENGEEVAWYESEFHDIERACPGFKIRYIGGAYKGDEYDLPGAIEYLRSKCDSE